MSDLVAEIALLQRVRSRRSGPADRLELRRAWLTFVAITSRCGAPRSRKRHHDAPADQHSRHSDVKQARRQVAAPGPVQRDLNPSVTPPIDRTSEKCNDPIQDVHLINLCGK